MAIDDLTRPSRSPAAARRSTRCASSATRCCGSAPGSPAVDRAVRDQIDRMRTLLEDAMEAGLAANQVGILNRVFVYRTEPEAPVRARRSTR